MRARFSGVISSSRNVYSSCNASSHSPMGCLLGFSSGRLHPVWGCGVGRFVISHQTPTDGKLVQLPFERLSSPMQAAHHRADRDVEDLGDLLVRETLDVGEQHGKPE